MSGLTVGYNGLNLLEMNAIENAEVTPDEENYEEIQKNKKLIKKIKPILAKKHLLLVTLLLANAVAMEALPIFLDALVPAVIAIILSTTAVLVFGEVLPQVYSLYITSL
jgi:metal transporter CNNM